MDYASQWKRYRTLRTHAALGCLVAGYLARLPWDVSRFLFWQFGYVVSTKVITDFTWAAFPVAAGVVTFTASRWLRFRCPGCDHLFMSRGPGIYGESRLLNPMAGHCGHCGLEKWQSRAMSSGHASNLMRFDELVREQIAMQRQDRKQA